MWLLHFIKWMWFVIHFIVRSLVQNFIIKPDINRAFLCLHQNNYW